MPTEVISYYLKNEDRIVRLGFQVALQCAPVLKGIKISCLISMDARLCPGLPEILMGTDVKYHCLSCSQGNALSFLSTRRTGTVFKASRCQSACTGIWI